MSQHVEHRPSSGPHRLPKLLGLLVITAGLSDCTLKADELKTAPVLHLANGGFAPGALKDSDAPSTIRWQASPFVRPFDFPVSAINAVHYPQPGELPKPAGDYCFRTFGWRYPVRHTR